MIRRLKQDDAAKIKTLLDDIPNFTDNEVKVAMELVDIAASNPLQTDYNIFVYDNEGDVLGYHCTGRRALTDGVYDLYWIVSNPGSPIKGIGSMLLKHAETFVAGNKGRWLLAETSSKENYSGTRNFYLKNNYSIVAQINDFYTKGDSLIVFGKFFSI
jgi:aminoglycoside 6'-N-acetyltransferase I